MNHLNKFLDQWGDTKSKERLRSSDKSADVQKSDAENILKDMSFRFERSPSQSTLKLWASDIIDAGFQDWMVREVCKSIPKKFEKHPTLAQIMELLRFYMPQMAFVEDDLDKYSNLAFPHLKAKFEGIAGSEALVTICAHYRNLVINPNYVHKDHFTDAMVERCVLFDWLRGYCKSTPQAIIDQGRKSNEEAANNNKDYFVAKLRQYCLDNRLV